MRNPAQKSIEEKGTTMNTSIDYTQAIVSGKITFEQACALQGTTMTKAIQDGILTFEEACELQGMAAESSMPKKPKKAKKAPKKSRAKKAPEPEVKVKVLDNGWEYHTPKNHALTDHQVKRLDNAVLKLWEAGFEKAEWRVEGKWAWIYTMSGEKGTGYSPDFKSAVKKAFKGSKWAYSQSRGAVVYKGFLK